MLSSVLVTWLPRALARRNASMLPWCVMVSTQLLKAPRCS